MPYVNGQKCKDCNRLSEFAPRCPGCTKYRRGYFRGKYDTIQELRHLVDQVVVVDEEGDEPATKR